MPIRILLSLIFFYFSPFISISQNIEKISFDNSDSTDGYYLSIAPKSKQIKGVIVLLTSFWSPVDLLSETKLHNVAYNNDLLVVFAPMKRKLYADDMAVKRVDTILYDIATRFKADTSKFALAGYDEAGNIALRYTELTYQHKSHHPVQPKAVFTVDSPVDLFGLWHRAEEQIKKNYWPGAVGDAHYYIDNMTKENGTIYNNSGRYKQLTPFNKDDDSLGNERYLRNVALRLYYDLDIDWQLKNRRNSFYDTKIPEASELIKRLMLLGNNNAELVSSKQPGVRSNGTRSPNALSILDEVDCIVWLKRSLDIFDAQTWVPPYKFDVPEQWGVERFALPPDFGPQMSFKGVEDIRFTPGWGDSTSAEYWSYSYLWWLKETSGITAASVQSNLQSYYNGLVNRNIESKKIPASKQVPTKVTVKKVTTTAGDTQTFEGAIYMLDYMTLKPITLNALIHAKNCKTEQAAVLIAISPKNFAHLVWKKFDELNKSFNCIK